jgi:NADPH:quinone reductase
MPTTARAARIHEYGPPEVLRFEDIVVGEPGDDEALIRNTVIGLNFVDVYYRRGSLPVPAFPAIIGDEAAGVVEAIGKNVKNVSVGALRRLVSRVFRPSATEERIVETVS